MRKIFDRAAAASGCIVLVTFFATSVAAEKVGDYWQEQRDHYNQLSNAACTGDGNAYDQLFLGVHKDNNPVAKVSMAWLLLTESCEYYDGNQTYASKLNAEAAREGYPIGQSNYASRLLQGLGVEKNIELADTYYRRCIDNGYGNAAAYYAEHLVEGIHVTRSLEEARVLFRKAQELGADQSVLDQVEAAFADVGESAKGTASGAAQSDSWRYEDGEAYYEYYENGSLSAAVALGVDVETGDYYFAFLRNSDEPMIHFMGITVEDSAGDQFEIDVGDCFGSNCLYAYDNMGGFPGNQMRMSIGKHQEAAALEALKGGKDITFRYQTAESASNNRFLRFVLNLKGSRAAIDTLEQKIKRKQNPLGSSGALPVPRND